MKKLSKQDLRREITYTRDDIETMKLRLHELQNPTPAMMHPGNPKASVQSNAKCLIKFYKDSIKLLKEELKALEALLPPPTPKTPLEKP